MRKKEGFNLCVIMIGNSIPLFNWDTFYFKEEEKEHYGVCN